MGQDSVHTPRALTIAGSDSGGGAGIQADLKTFAAHGVFGTSAITAVTAQNTLTVTAAMALPPELVTAQMDAVLGDIGADAIKTGMLANDAITAAVGRGLASAALRHVVVDPVMVAKSGARLLEDPAIESLKRWVLPRAFVVTPNLPEAEVLAELTISSNRDAREAARRIHRLGPAYVVVKGGHAPGDEVVDLLFDGLDFREYRGARIPGANTHGTGCTFAAAIAANLALGRPVDDAVGRAKAYVAQAIAHGPPIGKGHRPLNHLWQLAPS